MSHVTDAFIFTSVLFDPSDEPSHKEIIEKINSFETSQQEFKRLDNNEDAYGGARVFQASIWAAAYNYLNVLKFIEFLRSLDWPEDTWVQFCYQDEHDEGFTLINIKEVL